MTDAEATDAPGRVQRGKRVRRSRDEARREILAAGAALLEERGFAALTVRDVMARTSVGRSTFYLYFASTGELAIAVLDELVDELFQAAAPWLSPGGVGGREGVRQSIRAVVDVWERRGPLLAALVEAARSEGSVGAAWECALIEPFVRAIAGAIRDDVRVDMLPVAHPDECARALIRMNEGYLVDRFGTRERPVATSAAAETLAATWERTLYGDAG